ncbi:MAG: phosphohydrolase [Ferruginibacter sp.]|nr:phosphohydrolase [Ferruginibacter sp.]
MEAFPIEKGVITANQDQHMNVPGNPLRAEDLVTKVARYARGLFHQYENESLAYHNLKHTRKVLQRAIQIGASCGLDEQQWLVLRCAAWFHDCGHLFGRAQEHEQRSIMIMRSFLEQLGTAEQLIAMIGDCIQATKIPATPKNLVEEILCDADTYHFGTNEFFAINELVKKESETRDHCIYRNWNEHTLHFLEAHTFFTNYAKAVLANKKSANIAAMRKLTGQ